MSDKLEKPDFDVFLSYNTVDEAWVSKLKVNLLRYGVSVWLDKDEIRPGDIFAKGLEEALDNCRAVAVVVSPTAIASGWVKEAYYWALSLAKIKTPALQVIPVIIQEATLPGFLQSRTWVDFRDQSLYPNKVWELVWGITAQKPAQVKNLDTPSVTPVNASVEPNRILSPAYHLHEKEDSPSPAERESWLRQLQSYQENLRFIDERIAEFVQNTEVPLTLLKNRTQVQQKIQMLSARLGFFNF